MAKYVLVAFDDDEAADRFVEHVHQVSAVQIGYAGGREELDATIRGVWRKPTKFCDCKGGGRAGFVRGRKYGWWVHVGCGKPTKAWAGGDQWHLSLGTNLLPISEEASEFRGPDHVRHPGYKPTPNFCPVEGRFKFKAEPGGPCPDCNSPVPVTLVLAPIHKTDDAVDTQPAQDKEPTGSEGV